MSKFLPAICAALVAAPLVLIGTEAAAQGAMDGGAQASPPPAAGGGGGGGGGFGRGGGGGFRGGGFRGGNRFYGGFYGGFGPRFGFYDPWYDPFWGPRYGYGFYGYYPPPTRVIVRERIPAPGYLPPPDGPPPEQNWYRCEDPQGFYPYVRTCNGPWQAVPVTPPNDPGPPQR